MKHTGKKTHFWSQLLLSMIAIFALPVAQGIETQNAVNVSGGNWQTLHTQQTLTVAHKIHRELIIGHYPHSTQSPLSPKHERISPHFPVAEFPVFAPIRAGPVLL